MPSVGYSAPTQAKISEELKLSLAESLRDSFTKSQKNQREEYLIQKYSWHISVSKGGVFAMIGALACESIADFIGLKGATRISSIVCIIGWLVIYHAEVLVFIAEISPQS